MDTIWNCAFGVDHDIQNKRDNVYFDKCEWVFRKTEQLDIFSYLGRNWFQFECIQIFAVFL
jgi:hypothetical protein